MDRITSHRLASLMDGGCGRCPPPQPRGCVGDNLSVPEYRSVEQKKKNLKKWLPGRPRGMYKIRFWLTSAPCSAQLHIAVSAYLLSNTVSPGGVDWERILNAFLGGWEGEMQRSIWISMSHQKGHRRGGGRLVLVGKSDDHHHHSYHIIPSIHHLLIISGQLVAPKSQAKQDVRAPHSCGAFHWKQKANLKNWKVNYKSWNFITHSKHSKSGKAETRFSSNEFRP